MQNRRRYIRISTVLPVEFYLIDSKQIRVTPWLEGFTRDIGRGGLCLIINDLWEGFWERFSRKDLKVFLKINLPILKEPIDISAKIIWTDKRKCKDFFRYFVGLEFLENKKEARILFLYAIFKKSLPCFIGILIVVLLLYTSYFYSKLNTKYIMKSYLTKKVNIEENKDEAKKPITTGDLINQIFNWIVHRQHLESGLIISYEGDKNLKEICFTYDQALAVIVLTIFGELNRAKKILDFYLKELKNKDYVYNAYYVNGEVAEYIVHTGPIAWLGLASLNYYKHTKENKYLSIAERLALFLLNFMDEQGGLKGGPGYDWYSTEQNLDAFAFFDLFYKLTANPRYKDAAEKIKNWITKYCYTSYGPPVKRGKGDSTIATDTFTMALLCFGPDLLYQVNMDPEAILEFAVDNCEVKVDFSEHKGIRGFDFAKARHLARGGIISCEWTAQMILSFEVLANYFFKKDPIKFKKYFEKSLFYFDELKKLIINSPSKFGKNNFCLPYASTSFADTGHGWYTPSADKYCSLAANSYFLFSYFGYNPLKAEFLEISIKDERK